MWPSSCSNHFNILNDTPAHGAGLQCVFTALSAVVAANLEGEQNKQWIEIGRNKSKYYSITSGQLTSKGEGRGSGNRQ